MGAQVMDLMSSWSEAAQSILPDVVQLRREIHSDPEVGLQCPRTTEKTLAALKGLPLEFRPSKSTTGFMAILRGDQGGRTVLLRGDMDALPMREETGLPYASHNPDAMHACGHDSHTAMLVGAARLLSDRRSSLRGTVVFMFQPGEEGCHGARYMIEYGLLDDPAPDAAFALHVLPTLRSGVVSSRSGPFMAAADTLSLKVIGRGGHAAWPEQTQDPIPVLCEIVGALQTFVARQISIFDPAVLTISKISAGTTDNVIPSHAELLASLRTLSDTTRTKTLEGFERTAHGVAAAHGLTAEVEIHPKFPVTLNNPRAVELTRAAVADIGATWQPMVEPVMAAEDFSYVLRRIPGAMSFLGMEPDGLHPDQAAPLHNNRMRIDESTMAVGVALHCRLAERFLDTGLG
jgi:amidohydrolase